MLCRFIEFNCCFTSSSIQSIHNEFSLGARLLMLYPIAGWLWLKLLFVVFLYAYMISLQLIFKQQEAGIFRYSGHQLRIWNEVPTIILFAIVFLVVLKNTVDLWWGLVGLFVLVIILMTTIRLYKKIRKKADTNPGSSPN